MAWIRNGVVKIVPSHEVPTIPRARIFPVPARVIRVNKWSSPVIWIRHWEKQERTPQRWHQIEVIFIMISIATTKNWGMVTFDVTTAFLQGDPTERETKQTLPELPEHGLLAIPPCALLKVLKSAYGLSEAPRLWFLRAHEALLDTGFEIVEAAPCCYRGVCHGEIVALLSLHVDDGLGHGRLAK
eukprot:5021221-Amphidinium_carterae.2